MTLPKLTILDEVDKTLRMKSKPVTFPLSDEDKKTINDAITYLTMSQIEKYYTKYDLRPGMGLAFIQLGIPKNIFVIVEEIDKEKFQNYVVINPKMISHSEELIYVGEGEGCLSVNREVEGIVPRYARMRVSFQDIDGNTHELRVREDISVAFQHEMDHLNGILFIDKIDKKNPFKNKENMREI